MRRNTPKCNGNMIVKQIHAKKPKTQRVGFQPQKYDLFTQIVKSQFNIECVKELQFHPKRRWRYDYAIPEYKIAIEVEGGVWSGGRHIRAQGFLGDVEKYNTGTLMGWRIFRVTPGTLYSGETLRMLNEAING